MKDDCLAQFLGDGGSPALVVVGGSGVGVSSFGMSVGNADSLAVVLEMGTSHLAVGVGTVFVVAGDALVSLLVFVVVAG